MCALVQRLYGNKKKQLEQILPAFSFLFNTFWEIFFIGRVIEHQFLLCLIDYLTRIVKVGDPVIWFWWFKISCHLSFYKIKHQSNIKTMSGLLLCFDSP